MQEYQEGFDQDETGLILTLTVGKKIYIGDYIIITSLQTIGKQTKIHICAPRNVKILRDKLKDKIEKRGEPWQERNIRDSQSMRDDMYDAVEPYKNRRGI